jgi:hypothetical protein
MLSKKLGHKDLMLPLLKNCIVQKIPDWPFLSRENLMSSIQPSKAHILTPFFRKTVVLSKICLGSPSLKFLEVCINSEYM